MSDPKKESGSELTGETADEEFQLTDQQRDALELDHNIAVTAGAGTGKTTTLKERYRRILTQNPDIDPDQVLTLTFTNNATNELRDRIRGVIDEELTDATDDTYRRWRRAKDGLADAYIHTIHGFCSRVLREFAVEASVNPDFDTLDEGEAAAVLDDATTAVLDHYSVTEPTAAEKSRLPVTELNEYQFVNRQWEIQDELATLTQLYSRSQLADVLQSLFSERPDSTTWADRWADESPATYLDFLADQMEVSIAPAEADQLIQTDTAQSEIATLLTLAEQELALPSDNTGYELLTELVSFLQETKAHESSANTIHRQQFLYLLADGITTNSGSRYSREYDYLGTKGDWTDAGLEAEREQLKTALNSLADLIEPEDRNLDHDPLLAQNGARAAIALSRVFQVVRAEYERRKDNQSALDYSDLITKTTDFLHDHDRARTTLREQFAYIMLDEVQDTDPRQWQLIRLLSGEDPSKFDGGNVFIIGDEKQSIFRFRDADVTQFQTTQKTLVEDAPPSADPALDLTGNFRTVEETLTTINELFDRVFQPAAGGVPTAEGEHSRPATDDLYESFEAAPQALTPQRTNGTAVEGHVEYIIAPSEAETDVALGLADSWYTNDQFVSTAQREARAVAARLTQLFNNGPEVYDPDAEEYTSIEPKHVVLLFRSAKRTKAFERAFENVTPSIPYTNLSGGNYLETPELRPLINLLRVCEDPYADIPLYGVLRSPLFGFTDGELATARQPDTPLWDSLKDASEELQQARTRLDNWRSVVASDDATEIHRWSTLISRVLDETGYLIGIGADTRPRQAVANVEKFREQLRTWEEGSAQSVTALLDRIEQERTRSDDPGEATIPGDIEGVQLRTIHSAKGLEFPVVIIPEVTRQFNLRSSIPSGHFERIDDEPVLGLKAPDPDAVYETTKTATYRHLRDQHRQRERAEQRRLLYVAATRARDHLIFTGTHSVNVDSKSGLADAGRRNGDWAEPWYWTDWLQPLLLDVENLTETLASERSTTESLGDGQYTISRPQAPVNWQSATTETTVATNLEIAAPPDHTQPQQLSATEFRDRLADVQDRPALLTAAATGQASETGKNTISELDGDTIGTIVHKLCELEPPRSEWRSIIRRQVSNPESLTDSAVETISSHAETGLAALREIESEHPVISRHDEVTVTLDRDTIQVVGDIDHLVVTADGYLVVDYKTSSIGGQSIQELTEHYLTQLLAYAGALIQDDQTAEQIVIALVFTDVRMVKTRTLTAGEVKRLLSWAESVL